MLFLAVARFKPGTEAQQKPLEPKFFVHLEQRVSRIRLAGPLQDDDGVRTGIFLVVEAHDRAAMEHLVSTSPFTEAGLYASIDISRMEIESGSLG